MKKIGFLSLIFLILFSNNCFAQNNEELLTQLNRSLVFMARTKKQYIVHRRQLRGEMPYIQVIPGRQKQIQQMSGLITSLGGKPGEIDESKLEITQVPSIHEALLIDGAAEIQLIEFFNILLYKYDDPQVQKTVGFLRDQSVFYFLLFDNISQMSILGLIRSQGMHQSEPPPDPRYHNPKGEIPEEEVLPR